jgi:hypothetical protein
MSKESNAQADFSKLPTNDLVRVIDGFVAFLCALAGFPHYYLKQLQNWGDKARVLVSGGSVVFSPLVGLISLWAYSGLVFGKMPVIMMVPILAAAIDWLMVSECWDANSKKNGWVLAFRISLACITLFMALYASLLAERPNLVKALAKAEEKQAALDPANKENNDLINKELTEIRRAIVENERLIQSKTTLIAEKTNALMNAEQEGSGSSGVNKLGVKIVGGGECGFNCKSYLAEADALQKTIDEIDTLPARNKSLEQKLSSLKKEQKAILNQFSSDLDSFGAMFTALPYANGGTISQIAIKLFILLILELGAFFLSIFPVSESLKKAYRHHQSDEDHRIDHAHKVSIANIYKVQIEERKQLAANLTPVIVRIPTAPQPTNTQTPLHVVNNESEGESKHG